MHIEKSINHVKPVFLKNELTEFHKFKESFHEALKRQLNSNSKSRPPKTELKGVLVPCEKSVGACKYRLESDSEEFYLSMSPALIQIAKKAEWEQVLVKGYLNPGTQIFDVETIVLNQRNNTPKVPVNIGDAYYDLSQYMRVIAQRGKLEPALEYLVS